MKWIYEEGHTYWHGHDTTGKMVLHNPNNWHWVDKNCISWSRDYFAKELVGVSASDSNASATITEVKSVEGDVEVCQRKGKVISLFDLALEMQFSGKAGEETEVAGKISVPEVSYDNDEDDYQFQITIDNETADKLPVKTVIRQKLVPELRKKLHAFGRDLIRVHGGDIQHKGNEPIHWTTTEKQQAASAASKKEASSSNSAPKYFGVAAYNTTSVTVKPVFNASPEQLYNVLLTPQLVAAWSRSPPNVDPKVGGTFELFGGNVTGKFVELKPNEKIKLHWRLRDWKPEHYATVTHEFVVGDGETTMTTKWDGVPIGQEEVVESNFNDYYVKPIKVTFGYGLV